MSIFISKTDASYILSWYEYATSDLFHYGDAKLIFPEEQKLISKLDNMISETELSDFEIERIAEWMTKSVQRKYGSSKYLFGTEAITYNIITKKAERIQMLRERELEKILAQQKRETNSYEE